jgi:hypothetical protein
VGEWISLVCVKCCAVAHARQKAKSRSQLVEVTEKVFLTYERHRKANEGLMSRVRLEND